MNFSPDIPIPAHLQPYISHIWYVEATAENAIPVFADGRTGLIFQQSGMTLGGQEKQLAHSFVFGQTVDPIILHTYPNCRVLGLIFHPHILPSVFRLHAKELTDECIDLSLLPTIPRVNLNEQLWNTVSPQRQFELLFSYLEKRITPIDPTMQYATNHILNTKGKTSLKDLHYRLNLTERTFERRFEQYVGISPRLFSNIAQFQAAMHMLHNSQFSKLSDIAYANGYADQSHFIRWFKKFTGVTPLEHCRNHSIFKMDIY